MNEQRKIIENQITDLMQKGTEKPSKDDPMGMVGFAVTLVSAKLTSALLSADAIRTNGKKGKE